MKIVSISLDKELFSNTHPEVIQRHLDYSHYFDTYSIIVFTLKGFLPKSAPPKLQVIPTNCLLRLGYYPKTLWLFLKLYKKNSIDLITTQDPFLTGFIGLIIKIFFKIPWCCQIHFNIESPFWKKEKLLHRLFYVCCPFILKQADVIRVINKETKKILIHKGIPESKIVIAPVPLDLSFFKKPPVEQSPFNFDSQFKHILFVGRLSYEKNVILLLKVFSDILKRFNTVTLHIIGKGPLESKVKKYVYENNLENNVIFYGHLNQKHLKQLYFQCHFLILPSLYESFGRVIVEAAMAKKPTLTFENGNILTGTKDHGLLLPLKQAEEELREAILFYLMHNEIVKKHGENAFEYFNKTLNYDQHVLQIIQAYQRVKSPFLNIK